MKFWLADKEKSCMRSIGKYLFSMTTPEIDIDLSKATREELLVLFQNVRYGFLGAEKPKEFQAMFSTTMVDAKNSIDDKISKQNKYASNIISV